MKYSLFVLVFFVCTSCIVFDKVPSIEIHLDNSLNSEIDSIILYDETYINYYEGSEFKKVEEGTSDYYLINSDSLIKIKLVFNNSKTLISNSLKVKNQNTKIDISGSENGVAFKVKEESKPLKYISTFLVVLIVLLLTKIPTALLILGQIDQVKFIIRFGSLNLLYLLIFTGGLYLFPDHIFSFLILYYIIATIIDFIYLKENYKEIGVSKGFLAAVISNFVFITLGQLVISIILISIII